jgi:hypothetical protein
MFCYYEGVLILVIQKLIWGQQSDCLQDASMVSHTVPQIIVLLQENSNCKIPQKTLKG